MERLNIVEIETVWGYKTFELHQGDITACDFGDLLAVSVLSGDYYPKKGTLVSALQTNYGLNLKELLGNCEFDLRKVLGCWISKEIPGFRYKRVLCVEIVGTNFTIEEVIENVFVALSILEAKGISVQDFVLPLLGTGSLSLTPESVIEPLLTYALKHLKRSQTLRYVRFVEKDRERALQLDQTMNHILGRVRVVLPQGDAVAAIRQQIMGRISAVEPLLTESEQSLCNDLRRIISDQEARFFELGILARKLVESIVNDLLKGKQSGTLFERIDRVRKSPDLNIAEWILTYMHVLRAMGNNAAHANNSSRIPPIADESDLELCLACIRRLLDFWIEFKRQRP